MGRALLGAEQPETFEARLNRAHRATVFARDLRNRHAFLERGDERLLFLGCPRTTDVVGQLRSTLCASPDLLERCDPSEQRAQHIRLLEDRTRWKLFSRGGIDSLHQRLKNRSGTLILHDRPIPVIDFARILRGPDAAMPAPEAACLHNFARVACVTEGCV